jgi:predicted secreted hydrolase
MKSKFTVALAVALSLSGASLKDTYRLALPGYRYVFPQDHFNHPEFQTEWWYYTGNLHTAEGKRFGFELTFFRHGVDRSQRSRNLWDVSDIWMAHLALSDVDGGRFFHTERLNRSGPGVAGADAGKARVWNGNWEVDWKLDPAKPGGFAVQDLRAVAAQFTIDLAMRTDKPPAIHGASGVSQKAEGAGRASHYISLTRLLTRGTLELDGKRYAVEGLTWMDHEFFTHQLEANQSGWDWFSLQLDDGSELMLFRLRHKDGSEDPYSAGTYVDPQGRTRHLSANMFLLVPGKTWSSPKTGGRYPIEWTIKVPSLQIDAALTTRLPQQELTGGGKIGMNYWEGAIDISATRQGRPLKGSGYLEMTGYAGPVTMGE